MSGSPLIGENVYLPIEEGTDMALIVALSLAGLALVVAANMLARRTGQPAAVLLVLVGLLYAVLPGPNLEVDPDVVLVGVLPPLLYATALNASLTALRGTARTVASMSVLLVLVTALAVGTALSLAVPSVPLAAAIALGAAVAPPDPVAALAVGRRAGLPPRLITLVEGEGLLNDATALTTLQIAVAAAVGGGFSVSNAVGRFLLAAAGGIAVGLGVAAIIGAIRRRLDDPLLDNSLSLAVPFAAYLAADQAHVSGVLAVVVAGLWLGHRSSSLQSSEARLQTRAVWRLVEFLLEGFAFLLIGQQLPMVLRGLHAYPRHTVVAAVGVTAAVVLLVRPVWLYGSARLPSALHARLGGDPTKSNPALSVRELCALSWAGTRGVITMAAVFTVPLTVDSGRPFPARDLLLMCAYTVVLVTLVGQGLTFGPLLRRLHLGNADVDEALVRNQARLAAVRASLARLDDLLADDPQPAELVEPLRRAAEQRQGRYAERVERLSAVEDGVLPVDPAYYAAVGLRRVMIDAERETLVEWRNSGRLPDTSLRTLQRELDHEEGLLPTHRES